MKRGRVVAGILERRGREGCGGRRCWDMGLEGGSRR